MLASVKLASSAAVVDVNAATGVLPVVTVADPLDVPVQPVASLTLDTVYVPAVVTVVVNGLVRIPVVGVPFSTILHGAVPVRATLTVTPTPLHTTPPPLTVAVGAVFTVTVVGADVAAQLFRSFTATVYEPAVVIVAD